MDSQTYRVGRSTITLTFGNLTTSKAEVLVSSDDCYLSMGGGVSGSIGEAAGEAYRRQAQRMVQPHPQNTRRRSRGDVVVTAAGELPARYVLHAITRAPQESARLGAGIPEEAIVRQACQRVMDLLPLLGCRSVAFPSIGTGIAGIDPVVAAEQMAAALVRALLETDDEYRVELYLMDHRLRPGAAATFFGSFEQYVHTTLALAIGRAGGARALSPPPEPRPGAADREAGRRFDIYTMLRRLDDRRDELDAEIQSVLSDPPPEANEVMRGLTRQLESVAGLRRIYESEVALPGRQCDIQSRSVFLSSTWEDLKEYRRRARDVIHRLKLGFIGMEEFLPSGTAPVDLIRQEVSRAEAYVGVIGMRYGSVDPALGFSMTELEYRQAVASRKPRHVFVMSEQAQVPISMLEKDVDGFKKLREFKNRVLKENVVRFFENADHLEREVETALAAAFKT